MTSIMFETLKISN